MSTLALAPRREEALPPSVRKPMADDAIPAIAAQRSLAGATGKPLVGHLVGVDPRLHVLLSTLARLARPFARSQWQLDPERPADALIIGLQTPEGVRAYQSRQSRTTVDAQRPVLVIGSPADLRRLELDPLPDLLLLAPPIKHLSFAYCFDVLATRVQPAEAAPVAPPSGLTARATAGPHWQLRAFPSARLLKAEPIHIRLAAQLLNGPITATTLSARTGATPEVITHFLDSSRQEGVLIEDTTDYAEPGNAPTPARVAPRLIAALRGWLGL